MCIFLWFRHTFQRPGLRAGIQNAPQKNEPPQNGYPDICRYDCIYLSTNLTDVQISAELV